MCDIYHNSMLRARVIAGWRFKRYELTDDARTIKPMLPNRPLGELAANYLAFVQLASTRPRLDVNESAP